jgi:Mg2+ and Co2+ transporter CorA
MEADPARLARGPSEVLYAIAGKIIDDYLDVVAEFEKDVDEIEAGSSHAAASGKWSGCISSSGS